MKKQFRCLCFTDVKNLKFLHICHVCYISTMYTLCCFVLKSVLSQNRVCCNLRTFAWRKMEPQIISVEVCEYRLIGQYTINSAIASFIFCVERGCDLRSGQPLEPHC